MNKHRRMRSHVSASQKTMATGKEQALHDVMMHLPAIAVQGYRMDGTTVYWNEAAEKLYGYGREEALGKNLLDLIIPPEMQQQVKENICVMGQTKKAIPAGELTLRHRDGSPVEVFSSHSLMTLENRETYLYCFDIDLSERNAIRSAMQTSEERYRMINQVSGIGSWEYNADVKKDWYSPMYFKMLGYDEVAFLSPKSNGYLNAWHMLIHPDDLADAQEHFGSYIEGGSKGLYEATFRMKRKDGTWAWILSRGKTLQDEEGQPTNLTVGTHVDITHSQLNQLELATRNQELTAAKAAADTANHSKNWFLANMSHELRTPLNGLMGMTQLMQLTELTEEQEEYMQYALQSCKSLTQVVEDILNYTNLEKGTQEHMEMPFALDELMQEVVDLYQLTAIHKGLTITAHRDQGLPLRLMGDRFKLMQILSNLVGNAVKFTETGNIYISALKEEGETNSSRTRVSFKVQDTGVGISKEKLDYIFQRFSQADESHTREYGGLGLGLAVAREQAAMMGCTITADSTPGKGSLFTLTCEFGLVE